MGRHTRPDDDAATTEQAVRPRLIVTMRPVNPRPPMAATTTVVVSTPTTTPPPAPGVRGPTPGIPPAPVIEPIGPPMHVGRRDRRVARRHQAEAEALAARIARAQRRARQVALTGTPAPSPALTPGPAQIPVPRPSDDAAPPWRSEFA